MKKAVPYLVLSVSAWKEFHDGFLSYGGPPIPMIRAKMLGTDYRGDTQSLPR